MPELAAFHGQWSVERDIQDFAGNQTGRFTGHARFDDHSGGLKYHEKGVLAMGAATPMQAERAYLWYGDGDQIIVTFADGAPFHSFAPHEVAPNADHFCAPDQYDVAYDFAAFPLWSSTWRVTGPRKDYQMVTQYRPAT